MYQPPLNDGCIRDPNTTVINSHLNEVSKVEIMTRKTSLTARCVLLAFIALFGVSSYAQSRITQQVDERAYVTLNGNTRPEAKNVVNYRGPVSAALPIDHMLLFLQRSPEQEQAVDKLINELNDRNSPNFHKWLTPEEFGERFGVDEGDIQQVTNWLQSHGFRINQVYPNRMVIDFSGTAGQIAEAFHTQMAKLEVERRDAYRQHQRSADSGGAGACHQGLCLAERLQAARQCTMSVPRVHLCRLRQLARPIQPSPAPATQ